MNYIIDPETKIYHRTNCECIKKYKPTESIYDTIPSLYYKGYTPCPICSPLVRMYEKEKKDLKIFALENGLTMELRDESLYIDTFLASWKIIHTQKYPYRLKLFHENTQFYSKCKIVEGNIIKQYHDQEVHYDTLMKYLQYIVNHDTYRDHENNSYRKKKRKKSKTEKFLYRRSKNRNISKGARRVYNIIDELEAKREAKE